MVDSFMSCLLVLTMANFSIDISLARVRDREGGKMKVDPVLCLAVSPFRI